MEPISLEPARPIPGDVVQLDPKQSQWGPVFVTVTECRDSGIVGYFYVRHDDEETSAAFVHADHGNYVRIGVAQWWRRWPHSKDKT